MLFLFILNMIVMPATTDASTSSTTTSTSRAIVPPFGITESNKECPGVSPRMAEESPRGIRPRRLDQLPPGRLELTVMREFDGCVIPAVVREGIDGRLGEGNRR